MKTIKNILAIAIFASCAKVVHPTGGPKDNKPPVLVNSSPNHGQTDFIAKEVVLTFDKEIEIDSWDKIKIHPNISKDRERGFTCQVKKNVVTLKFTQQLAPNTTYTVNFSDAIVTLSEAIPAQNVIVTFSTGQRIDDMQISGLAIDMLTTLPVPGAYILIYNCADDENPDRQKDVNYLTAQPQYFIKTDDEGQFRATHLQKGRYRVYACTSAKNMPKIDPRTDKYGQSLGVIDVELDSAEDIIIPIVFADITEVKVKKVVYRKPHLEIILNKPIETYEISPQLVSNLSNDKQTIYVYNLPESNKSDNTNFSLDLYACDKTHNTILQKIDMFSAKTSEKSLPSNFHVYPAAGVTIPEIGKLEIRSEKPMVEFEKLNLKGITLELNSDSVDTSIPIESFQVNDSLDTVYINYNLTDTLINNPKDSEAYLVLRIAEGSLVDLDGGENSSVVAIYRLKVKKRCASIRGNVYISDRKNYKIQLVSLNNLDVVDEIESKDLVGTAYKFSFVEPGKYLIRALLYANQNSYWSPGNDVKGLPPDPVYIYPKIIEAPETWEINDINLIIP